MAEVANRLPSAYITTIPGASSSESLLSDLADIKRAKRPSRPPLHGDVREL